MTAAKNACKVISLTSISMQNAPDKMPIMLAMVDRFAFAKGHRFVGIMFTSPTENRCARIPGVQALLGS